MDRFRIELEAEEIEALSTPIRSETVFPELARLGIGWDEETFLARARAGGEPYRFADEWRGMAVRTPHPDLFNAWAVALWLELCPELPCGDVAVIELAEIAFREGDLEKEVFLREAARRTVAIARIGIELHPDAPGAWLWALIRSCGGWDVLGWMFRLLVQLHEAGMRDQATRVCRAWMPLLREECGRDPDFETVPCPCLSGRTIVACCGRWGRG